MSQKQEKRTNILIHIVSIGLSLVLCFLLLLIAFISCPSTPPPELPFIHGGSFSNAYMPL